jgi:hypothetical protein
MQVIQCHECKHDYVLDLQTKPRDGGLVDVGFECPDCHTWNHCYFTNPSLEQRAALLKRFADKARRSNADWQRYQRKKAEYQRAYSTLNTPSPARLQPA